MIHKYKPESEFYKPDERCYITELYNSEEDVDCSVARARIEPGITTQLHCLRNIIERYVIIEGSGEVEVDGKRPIFTRPLDVVTIPAGASQRISNTGKSDLVFLCICTPRFTHGTYINMET